MAKKPEPIKMEFNCSISSITTEQPPSFVGMSYYDYLPGPESYPKLKVELVTGTAYNGRILLDTACADIVGDLNRLDLSGRRAAKVTVELPTLTDEEMAERETRARARRDVFNLRCEMRALESDTKRKLQDMQKEIEKLEKKYQ